MMNQFPRNFAKGWKLFSRDKKASPSSQEDPPSFDQEPWLYAPSPSKPAADGETHEVPGPGWQPDPLKKASERWWDGDEWTSATRNLA
jgi:hypothetical protein